MSSGEVLEFANVTKRFGTLVAVSNFSARIEPGVVTGFLGPNGAGKTTSLRVLLGQTHASAGTATIGGKRYSELRQPLRHVGWVLEAADLRPRRTAARHLELTARQNQIPTSRVADVLNFVGLGDEADARVSSYSLGMKQRLSIATALLGDPGAFVLDEPANGLDPEGIRWIRLLIRRLADEGRSVLVSSHVLSEIQQIADEVLIISRGELKYGGPLERLADPTGAPVVVDSNDREELRRVLSEAGLYSEILRTGLTVRGSNASDVGAIAANAGIALTTLQQRGPTLEDAFIEIVQGTWIPPVASEPAEELLFSDDTWDEPAESAEDAAEAGAVVDGAAEVAEDAAEAVTEDVEADAAGEDAEAPAEDVADGAEEASAEDAEADAAADAVDAADDVTEEASDSADDEAVAEDTETADTEASDAEEAPEEATSAEDDDDAVDDEVASDEYTPVPAASGLGSLVRTEDEADAEVADVTNDLRDQLSQLYEAEDVAVEAPVQVDEPAPAAATSARRTRRLFRRRSAEDPAPAFPEPEVEHVETAEVIEVAEEDVDDVEAAVGVAEELARDAEAALDAGSAAAASDHDGDEENTHDRVIESDPATAVLDVTPGDREFIDGSTVDTKPHSSMGPLFPTPLIDGPEEEPQTRAFGIPILWDRSDTVSNTIITTPSFDTDIDDADLDVVADEVAPEEAAQIAEQFAAGDFGGTRRERRSED